MSDKKPGLDLDLEDLAVLALVGLGIWIMLGALGYSAWLWFG